ncbi:Spy/CpxP family protein refolding chaperone [Marinomonas gallaica]|uniref:Spy/CpxP family protein refolding chaperone n=1 Tax=Marinomonas gallaica TaxID=1806667 RepID=UPI00083229F6|nr:Spy/CpxP family protein refolding chaperone [Marinomonas gallaica]
MNIRKKMMVVGLALPLMLGTASAFAGGKNHDKEGREHCGSDAHLMQKLDLSDKQQAQMKALRMSVHKNMKARHESKEGVRSSHRQAADELVMADKFDKKAAEKFAQSMADQQARMMVQRMMHQHEMFGVLTPEQKEQFTALKKEASEACKSDKPRHGKKHD